MSEYIKCMSILNVAMVKNYKTNKILDTIAYV